VWGYVSTCWPATNRVLPKLAGNRAGVRYPAQGTSTESSWGELRATT
jgi:hypothetical protein